MKRLIVIAAAAATLLSPLAGASAQGRGYDKAERRASRAEARAERMERREGLEQVREDRGRGRGQGGRDRPDRGLGRGRPERFDAPPPQPRGWDRGEYLPPLYRGGVLRDPGRFRLRTPPPGYDWVGVGRDIYLVQRGTGRVLDAIPDGF